MSTQRYTIHEQLGIGGNGAVYRAYDTQLKRWVAIKRLLTASEANSNDPDAAELRREADTLASMRNANIVTIFDVAEDDEGLFMVMELLEGPDLSDSLAHGPMALADFKQLTEQCLEALLAAHNLRVLHRDIKPENIKIERLPGGRLQAKIIDFGLARTGIAARKQTEDQAGSVMGSIYYMAPEQLSREPTDVRTDLYSLGCVCYEAISGRKAFDGVSMHEVIDKHLDHDLIPLEVLCPHLPSWLSYWVMRMMALHQNERPASAQQAIEEFRAWEQLPPQPGAVGWLPGYGYQAPYGAPAPGYAMPQPGYYPGAEPAHITSHDIPVYAQPQTQPAPTASMAMPQGSPPKPQGNTAPRPTGASKSKSTAVRPHPKTEANKKPLLIGAAVLALGVVAWLLMGGSKSTGNGGSKSTGNTTSNSASADPSSFTFTPLPIREELYPPDRTFPIPEQYRVVHAFARVATQSLVKSGNGYTNQVTPDFTGFGPIAVVNDLAKYGGSNPLIGGALVADRCPVRQTWASPDKVVKDNRFVLKFAPTNGKLPFLTLWNPMQNKDQFPFGKAPPPPITPGLSIAVVFQATQAPTRVFRLATQDGKQSVTLRVLADKTLETEFVGPSSTVKIRNAIIDATLPSSAVISWDPQNTLAQVRARDGRGAASKQESHLAAPTSPLIDVQIGSPTDNPEHSFHGLLAEFMIMATSQKDDQRALLDKDLRDHYFNQSKPGTLNPKVNSNLADFAVGEARSIFNGQDSKDWNLNPALWRIENSELIFKGTSGYGGNDSSYAVWMGGMASDFELSLKVKITQGNSGINFRGNINGINDSGPQVGGLQMELESNKARLGTIFEANARGDIARQGKHSVSGSVTDPKNSKTVFTDNAYPDAVTIANLKTSDWIDIRLVVDGNKTQCFVNGQQVSELVDEFRKPINGVIGLEGRVRDDKDIRFKDIKIKRIR
jgi:Protein kinase domain/Domain of Unknown Function (DUF1080)